jgi:hypothetical protein
MGISEIHLHHTEAMKQYSEDNRETVCIWPDGTWCWLSEIDEYNWKSDDYTLSHYYPDLEEL